MTPDKTPAVPARGRSAWRPSVWQRFMLEWLFIGCFGVATVFVCAFGGVASNFDRLVYDRLLTLRAQPMVSEIALVSIDDDSVSAQGRWPWPRALQARLIDAVAKAGAAAIVYDVLLTEPAPGDDALAGALRVVPAYLPLFVEPRTHRAAVGPVPELAEAAAGTGHIDVEPDPDGIVRGVALREGALDASWPYLVMPLLDDIRSGKVDIANGRYRAKGDGATSASGASGADSLEKSGARVLIPFSEKASSTEHVSAREVLDGELPANLLRGKVVFVGLTASGLLTHLATPISGEWGPTSDVAFHANVLNALLTERAIRPVDERWLVAVSLAPLAVLLAGFLFLSPWRTLLLTIGLGVFSIIVSAVLLERVSIWISPVPTLIVLLAVYPLWSWRRLEMTMSRLQRELRQLADDTDLLPGIPASLREVRGDALERHIALVEQAAERVQDMKRFFWDCLNSLPEPIFVADGQGFICVSNKAAHAHFAHLANWPPEGRTLTAVLGEMVFVKRIDEAEPVVESGGHTPWPEVLDPTDFERVKIVKRGIEVRDRADRDYLLRYARCRNARGEPSGYWVAGLVEVTALHVAEQAREDALRLLSHDLRSPHASVLALIDEGLSASHSERTRTMLQHIERYTRRALTLADDFVQLTRAQSQAYVFEPVNFIDVVLDASDEIWPQARAKRIRIDTHFDSEAHWIRADRSLMTRAVTNLLSNAVKYSPADTIVHVSLTAIAGEREHCRIADQGYGMAEDARIHLFERFRRFRVPGQPHTPGAGLGMAFVKTVVTRHDGDVNVESELGRGTVITVSLPSWTG